MAEKEPTDEEIKRFEKETGKNARWHGVLTETFKKWAAGQTIYTRDKERVTLYIDDAEKKKWQEFSERLNYTLSKLIRTALNFYIDNFAGLKPNDASLSTISHNLKEPLTIIKGYSQLLLSNYKEKMDAEVYSKLREIFEKSVSLENRINDVLENRKTSPSPLYDVLIVEDDSSTVSLLTQYCEFKGYKCKGITQGANIIPLLKADMPKLVLLDVSLPGIDGFEICKLIKADPEVQETPVFFITALPEYEISKKMAETKANGYFLKPFDLSELDKLKKYVKDKAT